MISLVRSVFRIVGAVFLFFFLWFLLITVLATLQGCSRTPRERHVSAEIHKRTFITGTTEAIRGFRPGVKRPQVQIQSQKGTK